MASLCMSSVGNVVLVFILVVFIRGWHCTWQVCTRSAQQRWMFSYGYELTFYSLMIAYGVPW